MVYKSLKKHYCQINVRLMKDYCQISVRMAVMVIFIQ